MKITFDTYTFSDAAHSIISADSYKDQALIADTLQSDTFNFAAKVDTTAAGFDIDDFESFDYGTPVSIYDDNDVLQAVFYAADINARSYLLQTNEIIFDFECLSFVGVMIDYENNGGIWQNSTNRAVISYILDATLQSSTSTTETWECTNGLTYVIDKKVANKRVDGWLPIASVRDNLCKVLNASCVSILKNTDGSIRFTFNQPDTPIVLDPDYEYLGDSYSKTERYTDVAVVEHSYYALPTTEEELIYDSESTILDGSKVIFEQPYYALRWTGTSIDDSNCNYATLTGSGELYGKPYIHGQNQISATTGLTGTKKYYISDSNTLITGLNSASALERLQNYYGFAKEIECDFVVRNGITTGSLVSLTDPLNRLKSGFVKRMETLHSGIDKAHSIIVTDWTPVGVDEDFEHCDILTDSGTYTTPAGKNRILVVCIQGGQAGYDGQRGEDAWSSTGAGGEGGAKGSGGSIKQMLITSPASTYAYSTGAGGASNGAFGAHSTFGSITSADGSPSASGYMNLINGDIIAKEGVNGVAGGNGGAGGSYVTSGSGQSSLNNAAGEDGGDVYCNGHLYRGGTGNNINGRGVYTRVTATKDSYGLWNYSFSNYKYYAGGAGGGGGAAVGSNGYNGGYGTYSTGYSYSGYLCATNIKGGDGGNGANASAPDAPTPAYGDGGYGGHGGGGGGGSGSDTTLSFQVPDSTESSGLRTWTSGYHYVDWGEGGSGSAGTAGGHGAILVYY